MSNVRYAIWFLLFCFTVVQLTSVAVDASKPEGESSKKTSAKPVELLKNASFETIQVADEQEPEVGDAVEWTMNYSRLGKTSYYDSERLNVLEFGPHPEERYINVEQYFSLPQAASVRKLKACVEVKCATVGEGGLTLFQTNKEGKQERLALVSNKKAGEWEQLTALIEIPANAEVVKVLFRIFQRPGASETMFVDNASVLLVD